MRQANIALIMISNRNVCCPGAMSRDRTARRLSICLVALLPALSINRLPAEPLRGFTIPLIDLAAEPQRQVIVDREPGQYLGHPTTVLLEDSKTILCVYPKGHGRGPIIYRRSSDGGLTWSKRLPVPGSWASSKETPTIHRVADAAGKKRLIVWSGLYPARLAVSEDDGQSWSELRPSGGWGGIVVMGCLESLRTGQGHYLAMFHDDGRFFTAKPEMKNPAVFTLYKTLSTDGGLTWSMPETVWSGSEVQLCEPGLIRSPDGRQIAVLLRENARRKNSHVIFSDDEGRTWSAPRELPGALTGDRHCGKYGPDGRLFISFRDTTLESPTKNDWAGWVGTYEDIAKGREGQYRVRLMKNHKSGDCAYPGVEVLPDGTFVTTTYGHWTPGEQPYIVSVRFRLSELDAKLAARQTLGSARSIQGGPEYSDVFTAGKDGFTSIRIPSVVVTRKGTVLAIGEGRARHADQANNKLILKRSADGGRSWGLLQVIADDGRNCLNNPCAVVEQETGRVIVMYQSYPAGLSERDGKIRPGLDGPAIVRNYVVHSDDEGATWSKPRDVTRTTKAPERVTIVASGPGLGIQLRRGPHAGRLIMPFNEGPFGLWNVLSVYSDDRGQSWKLGQPAPGCRVPDGRGGEISLVNEVQMVELDDGSVMLNSRRWGGAGTRKTAGSKDGGVTWSKIEEAPDLRDPGCMASIFRYSYPGNGGKSLILYSGPDSAKRENGTVRLSHDEGKTWPVKKVLFAGSFAYSVLTALPDGTIGCLFETDNANRIVFARFTLDWLTSPPSATN